MNVRNKELYTSFYDNYRYEIAPCLEELDTLAKTGRVDKSALADALGLSFAELCGILSRRGIKSVNKTNLHIILSEGKSEICRLYQREIERGSPCVYTRDDIAYIYQLDRSVLNEVCDRMGIKETTAYFLPLVFSKLPPRSVAE